MAWIKIKCSSDITMGDVLAHDSTSNIYTKASDMNTPLYVAMGDAQEDLENPGTFLVKGKAQGQIEAKCSRNISDEGGFVAIENGAVYIDNSNTTSPAIIWNNFINAQPRAAGDLVTITLR